MAATWESALQRWAHAGIIDAETAQRIRAWEVEQGPVHTPSRLAALAFGFGGLLAMAGVFLFVSAHWDTLAPFNRFGIVLAMVALFHVAAATTAAKLPALATALHAAGTGTLGAGIFLCGQIFNMAEHWPGALMLWAIGAAVALWLLRDWPQVLWLAILTPSWLLGEWFEAGYGGEKWWQHAPPAVGVTLLSLAYLAAGLDGGAAAWRRVLSRLGAIALIPSCIWLGVPESWWGSKALGGASDMTVLAWLLALSLPLVLAFAVALRHAVYLVPASLWCVFVVMGDWHGRDASVGLYLLYAVGALGVAAAGIRFGKSLLVNLGVTGFALTVLAFYFSSVFDKLGRSVGLMGLGVLFLGGGWMLERVRRRLVAHAHTGRAS